MAAPPEPESCGQASEQGPQQQMPEIEVFRRLTEGAAAAIGIVQGTRFVYANVVVEKISGYSMAELMSMDITQLIHPDFRDLILTRVRERLLGELVPSRYEFKVVTKGGEERWIDLSVAKTEYNGQPAMIWAGLDVTERKQAEEAMRESERRLKTLMANLPGLAYRCRNDPQWTMEFISDGCLNLTGYPPSDIVNNARLSFSDLIHPDDRQRTWIDIQIALQERRRFQVIYRMITAQQETKWVWEQGCGVYDARGQVEALEGFIADITAKKLSEQAIQKYSSELKQSNRDLEQFAHIASHDLQEPLRMVTGFLDLLRDHCGSSLDKTANEYIDFVIDGSMRMKNLIDGALAYSRIGSRAQPLETISMQKSLDGAVANLRPAFVESGAVITHDPLPMVRADAVQMTQLFQNLLSNAIKFRSQRPLEIRVGACEQGEDWLFSVQDNGIGMEASFRERAFQMFERRHTRQQFPGTGVGLAICKKIIDRHGGRIWLESEPGKGSTFYFTIPKGE